jgi:beta-lactamase class A
MRAVMVAVSDAPLTGGNREFMGGGLLTIRPTMNTFPGSMNLPEVSMWRLTSYAIVLVIVFGCTSRTALAQLEASRGPIQQIASGIKAKVGVAVADLETGDTIAIDGSGKYPMQSVYKFPLGLAVLHRVDNGRLALGQKIHIGKSELRPDTWSPMREKYPEGNVDLALSEVIRFTVSQSDNNGCDILFRLMGGTDSVDSFIRALGISEMAIVATEEEMHRDGSLQYRNWSSPAAMAQLLRKFYRGEVLSEKSTSFLRQVMEESPTGPRRIKGLLPKGTVVAHKTGSSGADEKGMVAATNDVGVVTLPGGRHVVIAVFVSDAAAEEKACEDVIAKIARVVWDLYASGPHPVKR